MDTGCDLLGAYMAFIDPRFKPRKHNLHPHRWAIGKSVLSLFVEAEDRALIGIHGGEYPYALREIFPKWGYDYQISNRDGWAASDFESKDSIFPEPLKPGADIYIRTSSGKLAHYLETLESSGMCSGIPNLARNPFDPNDTTRLPGTPRLLACLDGLRGLE